jgi:periplasmic protein TonB
VTSETLPADSLPGEGLRNGLPPASDRMLTTLFLAALLHGIIILGVTFSSGNASSKDDAAAGLQIVLTDQRAPTAAKNPNAHYLSQRTQLGSGNTLKNDRSLIPKSSLMPVDRLGLPSGDGMAAQEAGAQTGDEQILSTRAPSEKIFYFASNTAAQEAAQLPMLLEKRPDLGMTPNDDGVELRIRGESKRELWIAADTQESDVAVYLDAWRRKIERVGTVNFPAVARHDKLSGTPVIEVTIGADGKLLQTTIKRSSGHAELDEAAVRILKLAAPYDPFPGDLSAKHDEIRIAYEWQFLGGSSQGGSVFYDQGK